MIARFQVPHCTSMAALKFSFERPVMKLAQLGTGANKVLHPLPCPLVSNNDRSLLDLRMSRNEGGVVYNNILGSLPCRSSNSSLPFKQHRHREFCRPSAISNAKGFGKFALADDRTGRRRDHHPQMPELRPWALMEVVIQDHSRGLKRAKT